MSDQTRNFRSDTWAELENDWLEAKADQDEAKARLAEAVKGMKAEVRRRGRQPKEPGDKLTILGTLTRTIYRLDPPRIVADNDKLKADGLWDKYSKETAPSFAFNPKPLARAAAKGAAA